MCHSPTSTVCVYNFTGIIVGGGGKPYLCPCPFHKKLGKNGTFGIGSPPPILAYTVEILRLTTQIQTNLLRQGLQLRVIAFLQPTIPTMMIRSTRSAMIRPIHQEIVPTLSGSLCPRVLFLDPPVRCRDDKYGTNCMDIPHLISF